MGFTLLFTLLTSEDKLLSQRLYRSFVATFLPQEPVTLLGQIGCDSNGKLNNKSVILEGDREHSSGARVPVDLSELKEYSLFPGQVSRGAACSFFCSLCAGLWLEELAFHCWPLLLAFTSAAMRCAWGTGPAVDTGEGIPICPRVLSSWLWSPRPRFRSQLHPVRCVIVAILVSQSGFICEIGIIILTSQGCCKS